MRNAALSLFVVAGLLAGIGSLAQGPAQNAAGPPPQATPVFSGAQLDQLLAPIALYPDDLLGQILMAAAYPLEIVQADRWLQVPANASLRGTELAQALQQQPWDPSVKSLVAYPEVLSVLDNNLQWTEDLGEAFLAQQADVMDHVQQLRARALAARTLNSNTQQTVTNEGPAIEIAPASPDTVYVPVYDPNLAYGDWPYPDYLPYYFDMPGFAMGSFVGFAVFAPLWGWNHWDWGHHQLIIAGSPGVPVGGPGPLIRPVPWRYDPGHRGFVPYRTPGVQTRFTGPGQPRTTYENFRGYLPSMSVPVPARVPALHGETSMPAVRPAPAPQMPRIEIAPSVSAFGERPAPPALESFGAGPQVRVQEQRGAGSRMSVPAASGGKAHR